MIYIHMDNGWVMPDYGGKRPFIAVLILNVSVNKLWRGVVSKWLVDNGCRYMMAWGIDCSAWDDSVDLANLERFNYGDIPDDEFVMTTWHDNDSLDDVFWFCGHCATVSNNCENEIVLMDIGGCNRADYILSAYKSAQQVDAAEASAIAVPPSEPSGSPR